MTDSIYYKANNIDNGCDGDGFSIAFSESRRMVQAGSARVMCLITPEPERQRPV